MKSLLVGANRRYHATPFLGNSIPVNRRTSLACKNLPKLPEGAPSDFGSEVEAAVD
jgi:hypothetical protein